MNILIIKLGALGDVLRTTSILQGLKENYPDSEITWITKENAVPLLINNYYIEKVLTNKEFNSLRSKSFDLVINLDEDIEACSLVTKIKYKKLVGFYLNRGQVLPTETAKEYYDMSALGEKPKNDILKKENKKTYQQLILEIIGIKAKNYDTLLYLTKKQNQFAKDFARRYNINKDDLVIGINTGSAERWPKSLSVEKTASLIEKLHKELKCKIILFGGLNEIERNNQIISLARAPLIHSGCGNNLFEFPAVISLCKLFITSDTLGLHVALALKRKTIALFGPTSANEIEIYDLGKKIISESKCYCCYKSDCKAMKEINVNEILREARHLTGEKISIIITAFKEPNLDLAIKSILNQKINYDYEVIVVAPDKEAEKLAKKYNIKYFKDPGKGKSYALNLLLKKIDGNILIFTDGDVSLAENSVNEMVSLFRDPLMGIATGRVVSSNNKDNKMGYWSHLLADAGAHRIRKKLFNQAKFLECSGYLFAFRNNVVKEFPLDVAEDTFIPYMFYIKNYKIGYAEKALVYVKNPDNFRDWLKQRKRTSKAHETLLKYYPYFPRVKSFSNEIRYGFFAALSYPKTIKEMYWTILLFFARAYMWTLTLIESKLFNKQYRDAWERVQSTK